VIPPGPTGATGYASIVLQFSPQVSPLSFSWTTTGSGTVDYSDGRGKVPFMSGSNSGTVPPNGIVSIYSSNITILRCNGQPIMFADISNAPSLLEVNFDGCRLSGSLNITKNTKLQTLSISGGFITGLVGLKYCKDLKYIALYNNLINQINGEDIANQIAIATADTPYGSLYISSQRGQQVYVYTLPFQNLLYNLGWDLE